MPLTTEGTGFTEDIRSPVFVMNCPVYSVLSVVKLYPISMPPFTLNTCPVM
jgi:hypothetical protein